MAQKSSGASGITNQIGVVLLTMILLFFVVAFAGEALEEYRLLRELEQVDEELDRLKSEGTALAITATYMESPGYAEQELKKMGWVRRGETAIVTMATVIKPVPTPRVTLDPLAAIENNVRRDRAGPPYWPEWLALIIRP